MDKETFLRKQLADLQESYRRADQPIIDELVRIDSMRVRSPIIPIEQLETMWEKNCVHQPNPASKEPSQ